MSGQCIFISYFRHVNQQIQFDLPEMYVNDERYNYPAYIETLYTLLESINNYGNINDETDILIYTTSENMNIIKKSILFSDKIVFEINDTGTDCKSLLDVFDLKYISKYNKILYLDINTIVKGELNIMFNLLESDVLYGLNIENNIISLCSEDEFEECKKQNKMFTTGVLLFNTSDTIRELFKNINDDIIRRPELYNCNDEEFIVYNSFKYNLFNNIVLQNYVVNNDYNCYSDKIIHYFSENKTYDRIYKIKTFLNILKDDEIRTVIDATNLYINKDLLPIFFSEDIYKLRQFSNCYYNFKNNYTYISNILLNKKRKKILMIEFNYGLYIVLMLKMNPTAIVTCIEENAYFSEESDYKLSFYNKIKETFGDRFILIRGENMNISENITGEYDLIFINTYSSPSLTNEYIIKSYKISNDTLLILNDSNNHPQIKIQWDDFLSLYGLTQIDNDFFKIIYISK